MTGNLGSRSHSWSHSGSGVSLAGQNGTDFGVGPVPVGGTPVLPAESGEGDVGEKLEEEAADHCGGDSGSAFLGRGQNPTQK